MDKISVRRRKSNSAAYQRKELGRYLRRLRENRKLTQGELAALIGFEYYTSVSQIELGRGRLPSSRYEAYATALGVPVREFVRTVMRHYDPITYSYLFGDGLYDPHLPSDP